MAVYVGVDFGARCIEICEKNKGVILREPNLAAVDTKGNVIAVGSQALLVRGRAPGTVTIRRPVIGGTITDFNLAAEILDRCLEIAVPKAKKHVIAAVKYGFGVREREMIAAALHDCRTGKIKLVEASLAALLGAGIDVDSRETVELTGNIVCDIGADGIEAAYVRAGEILRIESRNEAGDAADAEIIRHVGRKYGVAISQAAAREAKHKLSLFADQTGEITVSGVDNATGMPRRVKLDSVELLQPCAPQIEGAVDAITRLLSNLPRHGENESAAERIILVGGGAMLEGIGEYVGERIGREVTVADEPLDAVSRGLCILMRREEK